MIKLLFWRLDVDRIHAKAIGSLPRVSLIPPECNGLHQSLKFGFCHWVLIFVRSLDTETSREKRLPDSASPWQNFEAFTIHLFHFASEIMYSRSRSPFAPQPFFPSGISG